MRNRTPNSSHCWYDELQSENTQALLDRLEFEMDKEEIDTDLIDAILKILDERVPVPEPPETPEESLRQFREKYAPLLDSADEEEKRPVRRRHVLRYAAAACICAVMFLAAAQANGMDLIGQFLEWGEETFVIRGRSGQMVLDDVPEGEYASVEEATDAFEITDPVAPKWMPVRYHVQSVRVKELDGAVDITARYVADNEQRAVLKIYKVLDNSGVDDSADTIHSEHTNTILEPDSYEKGGIEFLLANKNSQHRATWETGTCTCSINGDLTRKEIIRMIDSIFLEEG